MLEFFYRVERRKGYLDEFWRLLSIHHIDNHPETVAVWAFHYGKAVVLRALPEEFCDLVICQCICRTAHRVSAAPFRSRCTSTPTGVGTNTHMSPKRHVPRMT